MPAADEVEKIAPRTPIRNSHAVADWKWYVNNSPVASPRSPARADRAPRLGRWPPAAVTPPPPPAADPKDRPQASKSDAARRTGQGCRRVAGALNSLRKSLPQGQGAQRIPVARLDLEKQSATCTPARSQGGRARQGDPRSPPRAAEPAKVEPVKVEPVKVEPAKVEPVQSSLPRSRPRRSSRKAHRARRSPSAAEAGNRPKLRKRPRLLRRPRQAPPRRCPRAAA